MWDALGKLEHLYSRQHALILFQRQPVSCDAERVLFRSMLDEHCRMQLAG